MDLCCLITVSSGKLCAVGGVVLRAESWCPVSALGVAWDSFRDAQSPGEWAWRAGGGSTGLLWSWIGPTSPGRTVCPVLEERVLLQSHTVLGGRWMWEYWCGSCQLFPQVWSACLLLS